MNRYYEHPTEKNFRSPVYNVRAVPVEKIVANSYNPNVVAPPEMKLLELSIWEDGYTMPCVCYYDAERDRYELVDGYHRYLVLKTSKRIYERERGLLPVTVIEKDLSNRMASTIRHNRARGTHNVELMSEIVAELTRARMSDQWIMRHIGMDRDELLRLKQITGLAELFADKEFSIGDADGNEIKTITMIFATPEAITKTWTKWDLSELGPIVSLRLNQAGGADNGYGYSLPAYYAVDDITVEW